MTAGISRLATPGRYLGTMDEHNWKITWLARLFVPAGLMLDEAELDPLPFEARFEIVREGTSPVQRPQEALVTCFDFLFYDGSCSCQEWMQGLMQAGRLDPITFLLHPGGLPLESVKAWGLPMLRCELADPSTWQGLPQAIYQMLAGIIQSNYGEIREVLARPAARLALVSASAGSSDAVSRSVAVAIDGHPRAALCSGLVIAHGPSLEAMTGILDEVYRLFGEEADLLQQFSPNPDGLGVTLVLCYEDGVISSLCDEDQ